MLRTFISFCVTVLLSQCAWACSVCYSANEDSRVAFYVTTIVLTCLPLLMILGVVIWIYWRSRDSQQPEL